MKKRVDSKVLQRRVLSRGFLPRKWGGFKGVPTCHEIFWESRSGVEFARYDWHGEIPANESYSAI